MIPVRRSLFILLAGLFIAACAPIVDSRGNLPETDDLDKHSSHFGGYDEQNRLVGSVRLILPSCDHFPIEEHCPTLDVDREKVPRQECAEISRLTISTKSLAAFSAPTKRARTPRRAPAWASQWSRKSLMNIMVA